MARKNEKLVLPTPKNDSQKKYINDIKVYPIVVSLGPAGTGKTFIASCMAAHYLKEKVVQQIIITRPTVPTGRSIGFFPGTLEEKMEPWCKPIMVTLEKYLGKGDLECQLKNGNIEVVPFETIRGRSFDNAFIILDEAQNSTYEEIKAFTTRIGENCTIVINGDVTQSDLNRFENGLSKFVDLTRGSKRLKGVVSLVEFTTDDIERSGVCKLLVEEFNAYELAPKNFLRISL